MSEGLDPLSMRLQGTHLVEASAGTGKTYTIATLFLRLLVELELAVDRILVVTFTEAAAAELRDRIRHRLLAACRELEGSHGGDPLLSRWVKARPDPERDRARLRLALRSFDEAAISTIHGFCHKVLHESAFETGTPFESELVANEQPLIEEVVADFWTKQVVDADPRFVSYLSQHGVGPRKWVRLANLAASHPDAPVLPTRAEIGESPRVAAFLRAFERCRELWWSDREELLRRLLDHPGLHKAWLPKAELPGWFQVLDAFFREEDPGASLGPRVLDKLTVQHLTRCTNKGHTTPSHPFFVECETLVTARGPLLESFELRRVELERALVAYVRKELPRRKRATATQSFDDLLQVLDKSLARRGAGKALAASIRGRYRAALIDEFQDTDPVQYRIFRAIYGGSSQPLFLIGDPKQAIYAFRGADVFAYLQAGRGVPARARHTMDRNWRSDPELLAALQHLFAVPRPFLLEDIDFVPVQPRPGAQARLHRGGQPLPAFEVRFVRRRGSATPKNTRSKHPSIPISWGDRELPAVVAQDIAQLLESGAMIGEPGNARPIHAGDVAVLVRKNAQAQQIQAALRRVGIPGVVYGDASVLQTREAQELTRVLGAIAEPTHNSLLRAAITTELLGVTADELDAMSQDDRAWSRWVQDLRRWHAMWVDRGFIQMFRALLTEAGISERCLRLLDGERRMTNLLHLAELLHTAATSSHLGPAGLLRWLQEARHQDQTRADENKLRLERDDKAVQLITIHRSKGLEYPVVYCPYLWSPDDLRSDEQEYLRFHDPEDDDRLKLDIGPKPANRHQRQEHPHVARAKFESDAEGLRLLYVALTRARHRVMLLWGAFEGAHHSALGYLLHADETDPAADLDARRDQVAAQIKGKSDDELLERLLRRAHPSWRISELDQVAPHLRTPTADGPAPDLKARSPRPDIDRLWRTASFTQIAGARQLGLDPAEGRDHDELVVGEGSAPPSTGQSDEVPLAHFPRGAGVGNLFHHVLEHLDFAAPPAERHALVEQSLRTFGLLDPELTELAERSLDQILATPLLEDGSLCLRDVSRSRRLDELEFLFPVRGREPEAAFTRRSLATALAVDRTGLPEDYPEHAGRLGFSPLRGFLKGFVDLVFEHDGRWYVVDYKTNHLGDRFEHYARPGLVQAMVEHHYVLQYHLYAVAVLRHLSRRVAGFDPRRDFGGVFYLFLRGMSPEQGPRTGVYFDRPPLARLQALDRALIAAPGQSGGSR